MRTSHEQRHTGVMIAAIVLAALLLLTACGSGGGGGVLGQAPSKPFTGREARAEEEVDEYVEKALAKAKERTEAAGQSKEEGELAESTRESLAAANAQYKDGKYADAATAYEAILEDDPMSLGANVNLTLALLQQQKNDDAFVQSLVCISLFEDDGGAYLNAQVAGEACGFSTTGVSQAVQKVLEANDDESASGVERMAEATESPEFVDYSTYNSLWSDIETRLHGSPDQATYEELKEQVQELVAKTGDEDAEHLEAYLEAVGTSLGFEGAADGSASGGSSADSGTSSDAGSASSTSSSEATAAEEAAANEDALPFVVGLNDEFNITLAKVERDSSTNAIRATFDIVNKSDGPLTFVVEGEGYDADESLMWESAGGTVEIASKGYDLLVQEFAVKGKSKPADGVIHLTGNVVATEKPDQKSNFTEYKCELEWTGTPTVTSTGASSASSSSSTGDSASSSSSSASASN